MQKIEDLIIGGEISVFQAMQKLDETGRRIVFVAPEGVLQAVLTDGDVRKFILGGGDLNQPVSAVANHAPKTLPVEQRRTAKAFLQHHGIDAVPIVNKQGVMVDIVFAVDIEDIAAAKQIHAPVVIMAGGLGTRLYPYTKILPKPLIPVGENPIIELVIQSFHDFGCADFTMIVNHKKNMIKSYFSEVDKDYDLRFIDEDIPLGTGGGLSLLKGQISETFFFTNCDSLINADYADVLRYHQKNGNAVTMVCAMKHFVIPYGVVELHEDGAYKCTAEKPEYNLLTNTGVYVVEASLLPHIQDGVKQSFPDIIDAACTRGEKVGVYPVSDASWMDMGQLEELENMRHRLEQDS